MRLLLLVVALALCFIGESFISTRSHPAVVLGHQRNNVPLRMSLHTSHSTIPRNPDQPKHIWCRFKNIKLGNALRFAWRKSRIAFASLFIALCLGTSTRASTIASRKTEVVSVQPNKKHVSGKKHTDSKAPHKPVTKAVVINKQASPKSPNKVMAKFADVIEDLREVEEEMGRSWCNLVQSLQGAKLDSLILLVVTSAIIPIFKKLNTSPILGFLLTGTLLGPNMLSWVDDVHMMHVLGELGIVFFLFEMGLELSLDRLKKMKKDVFGLGTSQFFLTAACISGVAKMSGLSTPAALTIGGSLSLSSSAFVLQLLKDKGAMGTRYGKASFGILLLQDLAVVPLLVVVELLGKGGSGLGKALSIAGLKALVSLSAMSVVGRTMLNPIFSAVAKSKSQEAFLSVIMSTVLIMSFVTKGIGLSDTLGAFLAGLLLAETQYHYQIESDIAPFRGLLLGFFFITVGFSIDPKLVIAQAPKILMLLTGLITLKASIITALSCLFGVSFSNAQLAGLLNSQAGEFSFVALGIAEASGLIAPELTKVLLTTVALSMAVTPFLADLGASIASNLETGKDSTEIFVEQDVIQPASEELEFGTSDHIVVGGYGRVGKMVCDVLDKKFIKYVAIDRDQPRAEAARAQGLPVFFGDLSKPETLKSFGVANATACVLALSDPLDTNKAVEAIQNYSPHVQIFARAKNAEHKSLLEGMYPNVKAMSPVLPEDSILLTLPFGGAVLQKLGVSKVEIDSILENCRKAYMEDKGLEGDTFDFLDSFRQRLPESTPATDEDVGFSSMEDYTRGVSGSQDDDFSESN